MQELCYACDTIASEGKGLAKIEQLKTYIRSREDNVAFNEGREEILKKACSGGDGE